MPKRKTALCNVSGKLYRSAFKLLTPAIVKILGMQPHKEPGTLHHPVNFPWRRHGATF